MQDLLCEEQDRLLEEAVYMHFAFEHVRLSHCCAWLSVALSWIWFGL